MGGRTIVAESAVGMAHDTPPPRGLWFVYTHATLPHWHANNVVMHAKEFLGGQHTTDEICCEYGLSERDLRHLLESDAYSITFRR